MRAKTKVVEEKKPNISKKKLKNERAKKTFLSSSYKREGRAERIKDYIAISKSSNLYKVSFLALAMEEALAEAEIHLDEDLEYISRNMLMLAGSKFRTEAVNLDEAFFIHRLVQYGASVRSSCRMFAQWRRISETKCRTAYHGLQRLIKTYPNHFDETRPVHYTWLLNTKREFPDDNPLVKEAFRKLESELMMPLKCRA